MCKKAVAESQFWWDRNIETIWIVGHQMIDMK